MERMENGIVGGQMERGALLKEAITSSSCFEGLRGSGNPGDTRVLRLRGSSALNTLLYPRSLLLRMYVYVCTFRGKLGRKKRSNRSTGDT